MRAVMFPGRICCVCFIFGTYMCIDSKHLCVRLLQFMRQEGISVLSLGSADGELCKYKGEPPLDERDTHELSSFSLCVRTG